MQLQAFRLLQTKYQEALSQPGPLTLENSLVSSGMPKDLKDRVNSMEDPEAKQRLLRLVWELQMQENLSKIASLEQLLGEFLAQDIVNQDTPDNQVEDLPYAISLAAASNEVETVLQWLGPPPVPAKRINAACSDKMGRTLLHEAEFEGHVGLMSLLLQMGAKVDAQSAFGSTPFMQTCSYERLEKAACLLLQWGAVSDQPMSGGTLPHQLILSQTGNKDFAHLVRMPLGGRRCEIVGLKGRVDLNGWTGIAAGYDPKLERYEFQVEHTNEWIKIRPVNLKRRDRTPVDPGKYYGYMGKRDGCPVFSVNRCVSTDQERAWAEQEMEGQKHKGNKK